MSLQWIKLLKIYAINSIFQNTIRKRWVGMPGPEKTEIRTQLHAFLAKNHSSAPAYIRNKVSGIRERSF